MQKKIGKYSIWFGNYPTFNKFPRLSKFDGTFYKKHAVIWLGKMLEVSYNTELEYGLKLKPITIEEAKQLFDGDRYYD